MYLGHLCWLIGAFLLNSILATFFYVGSVFKKKKICQQWERPGFDPWMGKTPWRRNGNPLQCSCLGNPIDRGACGLQSMGSQKIEYNWAQYIHFAPTLLLGLGGRGALSLVIILQRDGSQVLEKSIFELSNLQEAGRKFKSQSNRERIFNCKIFQINSPRRRRSGSCSQEET